MKKTVFGLIILLTLLIPSTCFAGDLIVSAAASLTNAFTAMKAEFEKDNSDVHVVLNFAASNPLLKQIESGAPVDVFASADQATMNKAADKNLIITESRKDFARNGLVLIAPTSKKAAPQNFKDILNKKYKRIAVGNPESVPAGRYSREVLRQLGLWDKIQSKLILGESVRQVLDYVVRAEVDCGFVYSTDAIQAADKVRVIEVMAAKTPVLYPIATIKSSKKPKDAQRFIDFVRSAKGQNILSGFGFSAP